MECQEAREQLAAFLDGEGPEEVSSHLQGCPACRRERQALERTWQFLGVLPGVEPSPGFRARFWERVREEESSWWLPLPRFVPALAGCLAVWVVGIGLGAFLYRSSSQPPVPETAPLQVWAAQDSLSLGSAYLRRMLPE